MLRFVEKRIERVIGKIVIASAKIGLAFPLPQVVDDLVLEDGENPGLGLCAPLELPGGTEGSDKGFLYYVFGCSVVAQLQARKTQQVMPKGG